MRSPLLASGKIDDSPRKRETRNDASDPEVDRLYEVPLGLFVERRDELAKRRRSEGRRDEATRIKALRRPSAAAGIVNQVIRSEPKRRRALLAAGDALRTAQEDLQAGKADARALRRAGEDEREAVEALVEAARRLEGDGQAANESTFERVRETLHAAAVDHKARAEVEAARLTRELSAAGFGGIASSTQPSARRRRGGKIAERETDAETTADRERQRADSARQRAAEADLEGARGEARERRAAMAEARRQLKRATAARDKAQTLLERAEAEAQGADRRLESAREVLRGLRRN